MRTPRSVATLVLSAGIPALGLLHGLGVSACTQSTETSQKTPQSIAAENTATEAIDDRDSAAEECALGESAHMADKEATTEAPACLGYENPWPGPGTILPGGHDPGGPGHGWGRGFADDPNYAQYFKPRDPDPYKAQRPAKQREYARIRAENRRHSSGRQEEHRHYPGGVRRAPDAPRATVHPADGPLNDKARCEDDCYKKYLDDSAYCKRLPKPQRRRCQDEASEKMSLCFRECSRKYPGR